jgi:hypothetical protein
MVSARTRHGPIGDVGNSLGNGVAVWFEVNDFDDALERVRNAEVTIVTDVHLNPTLATAGLRLPAYQEQIMTVRLVATTEWPLSPAEQRSAHIRCTWRLSARQNAADRLANI